MIQLTSGFNNFNRLNHIRSDHQVDFITKPVVIYLFIDPFDKKSWEIEKFLKKLFLEYGSFFIIRPIIKINSDNFKNRYNSKIAFFIKNIGLSIKAAGLQGNKAGRSFLSVIQEAYFLFDDDFFNEKSLLRYAGLAGLDMQEFTKDLYSDSSKRAFNADEKLINDMDISSFPTLVFFSEFDEENIIKLNHPTDYQTYVYILNSLLKKDLSPYPKPPIHLFLKQNGLLTVDTISFVYDYSIEVTNKYLNELKLKKQVKKICMLNSIYWCYNNEYKNDLDFSV